MSTTCLLSLALALGLAATATAADEVLFSASATTSFVGDVGQSFGTLFELRDASGRVIAGAGFPDVYNTCVRTDRYDLQFYVKPTSDTRPVRELLPRCNDIAHTSVQSVEGQLYAYTYAFDRASRRWDASIEKWVEDPILDQSRSNFGDGFMRVAGKLLVYQGSEARYDGQLILSKPAVGTYANFYYTQGHLFFYHRGGSGETAFTKIHACPWKPGDGAIDVAKAVVFTTPLKAETTFAWGQYEDQALTFSNCGGTYIFEKGQWRILRQPDPKVSYQVYSTVNYNGGLRLGQYPTGRALKYDGREVTDLPDSPPVQPGVAGYAREAQSTMLYGGDLYVGVWPWAELWRHDRETGKWVLADPFFTKPPVNDQTGHPWEPEITQYNQSHDAKVVINAWGHRICSLGLWQDSLIVATSAKGPEKRDPRLTFLTDEVYAEYGRVWKVTLPGHLSAPLQYRDKPTTVQCVLKRDRLQVLQDGKLCGEAKIDPALVADLKPADITWGRGLYGRTTLELSDRTITPALR